MSRPIFAKLPALAVLVLVPATFVVDLVTPQEVSVSVFYLVPVSIATWFYGRTPGLAVAVASATLWRTSEVIGGVAYSHPAFGWWNTGVRLAFFTVVTLTIASRRRFERELLAAREAATAGERARSEFVSRVTHELRTPLTAIIGFADVLARRAAPYLTPGDQQCVQRIRGNSDVLLRLVDGVLDLGRARAGRHAPRLEMVDLKTLADGLAADLRLHRRSDDVDLIVNLPPDLRPVRTDPALLRHVLGNLLGNALKFTDAGRVELRVEADPDGNATAMVVEDTGMGIPADALGQIFEPFKQADSGIQRRFGGSGLGLAIARDLCQLLGCEIGAESEPGRGSRFTVRLPHVAVGGTTPAPDDLTEL